VLRFQKKRKGLAGERCPAQNEENASQKQDNPSMQVLESERPDSYDISVYTAATIPATDLDACFKLIELTSSAAYKDSGMGWSASEKKKEMKLPDMKYMVLRRHATSDIPSGYENYEGDNQSSDTGEFAGFIEFMVTYEDGYEVLYCYEIHLMPEVQSLGLGEELMERFERIGRAIGLEKAMLTVFKSNSRALKFYMRVGYTEDESSPRPRKLRNGTVKEADYMIMSKNLR
jgi:ribosomal protein S18 acetylase RimI-like enzyme